MEPFVKPIAMQSPLCEMPPDMVEQLRYLGFVMECPYCRRAFIKSKYMKIATCPGGQGDPCGQTVDMSREHWAQTDYTPPPTGEIPTVAMILNKLTRLAEIKVESFAQDIGLSRAGLYNALSGKSLPRVEILRQLADICTSRGMLAEAQALTHHWCHVKKTKRRGRPFDKPEDYGMTSGFWEARADRNALADHGIKPIYPDLRR